MKHAWIKHISQKEHVLTIRSIAAFHFSTQRSSKPLHGHYDSEETCWLKHAFWYIRMNHNKFLYVFMLCITMFNLYISKKFLLSRASAILLSLMLFLTVFFDLKHHFSFRWKDSSKSLPRRMLKWFTVIYELFFSR